MKNKESTHTLHCLPKKKKVLRIDHIPKCQTKNHKNPKGNVGEYINEFGYGGDFSDTTPKV